MFNVMTDTVFCIGDIEGDVNIANDVFDFIEAKPNSGFVFMGDICSYYGTKTYNTSIDIIERILTKFFNVKCVYNYNTDIMKLYNKFKELYKIKEIDCYCLKHTQYMRNTPQKIGLIKQFNLLFGNKEISIFQSICKGEVMKIPGNSITVKSKYFDKKTDKYVKITDRYSIRELTVLYNYFGLCEHSIIERNNIFVHCYSNVKYYFKNRSIIVKNIFCAHNRTFGYCKDKYGKNVYICDCAPNVILALF
jgi:hypothetical protein